MVALLPSPQSCVVLAAALSHKYRTYDHPYNSTAESLHTFLDQNGILLSLCKHRNGQNETFSCSLNRTEQILAASWVQANQTNGFQVFRIYDSYGYGMVLYPTRVGDIRCLYPIDAASNHRDDKGCGPRSDDLLYGSIGKTRAHHWKIRYDLERIKRERFRNTPWANISCRNFIPWSPAFFDHMIVAYYDGRIHSSSSLSQAATERPTHQNRILEDDKDKYKKGELYLEQYYETVMGHPVCAVDDGVAPEFGEQDWFLTVATNPSGSFQPLHWNEMLNTMQSIMTQHPHVKIWNEVVLSKPKDNESALNNVIQAIFHVIDPNADPGTNQKIAKIAQWEAKKRKKSLFKVDLQNVWEGGDLFQCENDAAPAGSTPSASHDTKPGNLLVSGVA